MSYLPETPASFCRMGNRTLANEPHHPPFPEGITQAYQRYRLELKAFFELNSREVNAVDDLMQTLFLQFLKDRPGETIRDPRQYLFRAAWNVLHNANQRARRERSRTVSCSPAEFEGFAEGSNLLWVEDDTTMAATQAELDCALSKLPRACQVAVLRQYRDNKSYKEIAEELGVSVHAVKKYIMRSLNHFRIHFNLLEAGDRKQRSRS